ncbi:MAG: shikimate kinase [Rikenellaceae bacterium]|nr:shikimate kinase [Rikenellaceae bacterium]
MRLYLTGYMGTGKSTLGRKIAKRTELPFLDTDKMVEEAEEAVVADIITYAGEEYFRRAESRALEQTAEYESAIISTGGGLPVWGDNQAWIAEHGVSVYLKRTPEQILSRLSPHGRYKRPKLRGLSDEEVLQVMREGIAEREPIYSKADIVIECDKVSDDEIVDKLSAMFDNNNK